MEVPFPGIPDGVLIIRTVLDANRPERPSGDAISDQQWGLIEACWAQRPADRKLIEELLGMMKELDFGVALMS